MKALARRPWPQGADRSAYPKCWYEPLSDSADAAMGLRFTLSHPVTAAIPPGDENIYRMALGLAAKFKPLTAAEVETILRHIDCDEMLLFSTDFPHWHFDGADALPPGMPSGIVHKLAVDNPLATYPRLKETLS